QDIAVRARASCSVPVGRLASRDLDGIVLARTLRPAWQPPKWGTIGARSSLPIRYLADRRIRLIAQTAILRTPFRTRQPASWTSDRCHQQGPPRLEKMRPFLESALARQDLLIILM